MNNGNSPRALSPVTTGSVQSTEEIDVMKQEDRGCPLSALSMLSGYFMLGIDRE
jgi:hypothetical protein